MGVEQTWVIKTDQFGNLIWDKTIFTSGHDEYGLAIQTVDHCYTIGNSTDGSGGYKTKPSWSNSHDYWIIKFCETLQAGFTAPSFICPGTCIDFTNLSLNATSYQWFFSGASPDTSTAANPSNICYLNPGSYDVMLIASDATGSDTLIIAGYITVYSQPPPQSILQSGDTLFAIAGASSYQWSYNGNVITGATDYFYVATQSGNYSVVVTDDNGCEVEAVITNVVAGAQLTVSNSQLAIYPNPVVDEFTIHDSQFTMKAAVEVSIYNAYGEKVYQAVHCQLQTVNCKLFPAGLYYLQITSGEKVYRTKFIKSNYR